jgi:YcaO-like protein with predicted kinase domain
MTEAATRLAPDVARAPTGHARTYAETRKWIEPLLDRVPITRVHDVSPLSPLPLPVYIAVTPLARDLTVHAGKGLSHDAAWLSAVMEGIERVSAETFPHPDQIVSGTYNDLASVEGGVLDPGRFELPYQTRYASDATCSWLPGFDLRTGCDVLIAADLVLSPATEGVCMGVETNGLASGNTFTEAVLHALYEVVERDAVSQDLFLGALVSPEWNNHTERQRPVYDPATFPDPIREWVAAIDRAGLRIVVRDITNDIGVPVLSATLIDDAFPGQAGDVITFAGFGADLDIDRALARAVTEAVQSYSGTLLAARDDFEGLRPVPERARMLRDRLDSLHRAASIPWTAGSVQRGSLDGQVSQVLGHLQRAGLCGAYVVDLTHPHLDVPVVRVLVPGAAMPWSDSARRPPARLFESLLAYRMAW